jgi:hypothetical protein
MRESYPELSGSDLFAGSAKHEIDHRLIRAKLLDDLARGYISADEVCDATAALLTAATHFGRAQSKRCPVCQSADLYEVSFGFGKGLPPEGQVVGGHFDAFDRIKDLAIYVVEVCTSCRWNHLLYRITRLDDR